MKIVRFETGEGRIHLGRQRDDGAVERLDGELFDGLAPTGEVRQPRRILAPLIPTTVYCIGANYRRHCDECNVAYPEQPIVFMKGANALVDPGQPIVMPSVCDGDEVDYEGELAVVIGKRCKNVSRERALDYVLGYTCANDVSARNWQKNRGGGQWCRGKGFDTFLPLGPALVTGDEIPDPAELTLRTWVNGDLRQESPTNDMIFDIPELIAFLSSGTTLLPGTVILTGTPHGVGLGFDPPRMLRPGDEVRIEIDRIGALVNPVATEAQA